MSEVLVGLSWAIFRDREDFETLKYVYLAPIRMGPYLAGRALTKIGTATLGAAVALIFGRFVLGLPFSASPASLAMLLGVIVLGLVGITFLGFALAGAALVMARHSMNLNEGLTGAFYLFCGAVFPVEVLPSWAQKISLALPFTYWLELIRRLLTGRPYAAPLRDMGDGALIGVLALSTVFLALVATVWFRWCEHTARARGLIDWKTNY